MFDAIKRMFASQPDGPDWRAVAGWARAQRFTFKQVPESDGFAIDGRFDDRPWRLEWGPAQRRYIKTRELRIRMEMAQQPELQMMVLSRSLLELLEQETFDDFTQGTQTYVGSSVPEEMRWLAMWPRAALSGQREVRQHFAALGANPDVAGSWVEGPLGTQLLAAGQGLLSRQPPFMLMCHRARLYLRMELGEVDPLALSEAVLLFAVAAQQVLRLDGRDAQAQAWVAAASADWQGLRARQHGPT
ncbi:hypothetical protein [Piscinibacter sakaiensis]|uniref:hypothetical protein n=1 Tax=Piscinibacter sakaiensis TaxID=1547922 RepID=UPI003AABE3BC